MSKPITSSMYVRCLNHGLIRQLADFLDPQDAWKTIAVAIKKPTGEPRYNQFHIRRFEGLVHAGKSPTCELLFDWGTTNCKVGDLVDLLIRNQLLAAASLLLPDAVGAMPSSRIPLESQPTLPFHEKETVLVPNMTEPQFPTPDSTSDHKSSGADCDTGKRIRLTTNTSTVHSKLSKSSMAIHGVTYYDITPPLGCQHENLVEMIGFSNDGDHSCLIYAYMPNGSLLDRLACLDGTAPLSWSTRCNITWGTANGIKYLHDNNHIHRDIKSANILLNDLFVPKISDFGLARASAQLTQTVMTEKIVGTAAYMAPEALRGEVTPKSDVFSFGVVLLEIITGLSAVDENREPQLLLDIKEEIEDEEMTLEDYIDKKMETWDSAAVEKVYSIACQCLHERKNKRPDIKSVCELLQA
nr:PREDICTED: interleukin-1 receptor-associated kinase 4 [Latimeria chalumnae]|eukprot:XP_005993248.2 PREDICTED: interleukin-1 receptor-associated kinase 4 [Latimeria chalumnae]